MLTLKISKTKSLEVYLKEITMNSTVYILLLVLACLEIPSDSPPMLQVLFTNLVTWPTQQTIYNRCKTFDQNLVNREYHLSFCKICTNRKRNLEKGLICSLTNNIADFKDNCSTFDQDKAEFKKYKKRFEDEVNDKYATNSSRNFLVNLHLLNHRILETPPNLVLSTKLITWIWKIMLLMIKPF